MRLIPPPAGPAGETTRRSSGMGVAGVLAGLAAARPAGTGPAPAAGPQPAAPAGGGGR
jgi:hypothetical protein